MTTTGVFSFETSNNSFEDPKDKVSKWSLNVVYTEHGFGLSTTLFKPLNKKTDLFASLMFSGIAEDKEFEQQDFFGSSLIEGKVNRVYSIPLSIGVQHKLSSNVETGFIPSVSAGIAPALVLSTPYDKSFFSSLGYMNAKFAVGPFVGAGMKFKQKGNVSFDLDLRYYYQPIIGGEISSIKDKPITNVGGLQLIFGLNFMK